MSETPNFVAKLGRNAFSISRSGLALSSLRQKAISSATAPTAVIPRTVRKLAGADFKLAHQIPL
jgi:hypothetical protein